MFDSFTNFLLIAVPIFSFGYPFIMSWYWMAGGALFYFTREIEADAQSAPQPGEGWRPISILIPCYNEGETAEETLSLGLSYHRPTVLCAAQTLLQRITAA